MELEETNKQKKWTKRSEMNSENKRFSISPTRGEKKKT